MTCVAHVPVAMEPRVEGWVWFLVVVGCLVLVLLLVGVLRRRLLRPMSHTPTDTTDAWAEAGRRLRTPGSERESGSAEGDEESP